MTRIRWRIGLIALFFATSGAPQAARADARAGEIKRELVERLSENPFFKQEELAAIFENPLISRNEEYLEPKCADFLDAYDERFSLTGEESLKRGLEYYTTHKSAFDDAARTYSVPPEYILAILRIETYFGVCTGRYLALPRLYHLYKTDRKRKNFALREIELLLEVSKWSGWNPYDIRSSNAGAIGLPQFLPSSIKNYAVDGNKDGAIDLFDPSDAIPSIAHYLVVNHWKRDKKAALWNYNRDRRYVERVIEYARRMREKMDALHRDVAG